MVKMSPELDEFLRSVEGDAGPAARHQERLLELLASSKELFASRSGEVVDVVHRLANGCRKAPWRAPIGTSGLLSYVLGLLPDANSDWPVRSGPDLQASRASLVVQILRLVGNACADTDENRALVCDGTHLGSIIDLLKDGRHQVDGRAPFVVSCLYNVCLDYEPAQVALSQAGLFEAYVSFLPRYRRGNNDLGLIIPTIGKTLGLLAAHEKGKADGDASVPIKLLSFVLDVGDWDLEDFCGLVTPAMELLSDEDRLLKATRGSVEGQRVILRTLEVACTQYSADDHGDSDDVAELKAVRKALVAAVADMTATAEWEARLATTAEGEDSLGSTMLRSLLDSWLCRHHSPLQEAACLAFGNVACSDESSMRLVQRARVHESVVDLLANHFPYQPRPDDTVPSALLHTAVGLLRNLCIPAANKPVLGPLLLGVTTTAAAAAAAATAEAKEGDVTASSSFVLIRRLWESTDTQPQTQLSTVALTRLLLTRTPSNAALVCAPMPPQAATGGEEPPRRTTLHALIELFAKVDPEPTKTEAARTALALCRILHSPAPASDVGSLAGVDEVLPQSCHGGAPGSASPPDSASARRGRLYAAHEGLASLLAFLVTQTRFPALCSEAWFVFALMARSEDGARVLGKVLTDGHGKAVHSLAEAVCAGRKPDWLNQPEGGAERQRQDDEEKEKMKEVADAVAIDEPWKPGKATIPADRENGLVLLTELLKHGAVLSEDLQRKLEWLLNDGSRTIQIDKSTDLDHVQRRPSLGSSYEQEPHRILAE